MSSTTLQTFDLEALNSRSSTECQSKYPTYRTLKAPISPLLLVLEVCNVKPTYRKSYAGNLLMWSDLILDPSFKVKRGYPNLKVLITHLLFVQEVCNVKPTSTKSWSGNRLMCSDLTLGPLSRSKEASQS